ncbi:MAG: hypothetical protein ACLS9K_09100 [Lachnospira eligens]
MESRNVTIAEGYTIMGIESLKNNIAYLLHVYAGQISVEDIVSYVNEDIESKDLSYGCFNGSTKCS